MEPAPPEGSSLAPSSPTTPAIPSDYRAQRWRLVRDVCVFQAKLLVDGLKDLVLAPVALVVALIGLLTEREDPGRIFYSLLRWGHGFDRWVNLFGQPPPALPPTGGTPNPTPGAPAEAPTPAAAPSTVDAYVTRMETVLREQVQRGGLTAKAKDAIDNALDSLHRPPPPNQDGR